jgi:D-alanyl-D-alanine-carboxypeptidase/D-alanyl-D-alanine-endopeptidase
MTPSMIREINMNKILDNLLVLTISTCCILNYSMAHEEKAFDPVFEYIKRIVDNGKSSSVIIGIVNENGKIIFSYGELKKGDGKRPDGNTLYGIGSITKCFTCFLLADMVKRGELNLDDPISKFLPDSVKTPTLNGKEITLYHLATHTSGLPPRPDNLSPTNPDNPYADYSVEQMFHFLSGYQLTREIGSKYEYSNIGVGLLGYILAHQSDLDYETLVRRRICEPLHLNSTVITIPKKLQSNAATPYNNDGQSVSEWMYSPVFAGSGSFQSTVNDMLVFIEANLVFIRSRLSSTFEFTHVANPGNNVSLGWHIWNEFGTTNFGHGGSSVGYKSFTGFNKENKIGVIVLSNKTDAVMDIGLHVLDNRYKLQDRYFKNELIDKRDNHIYKTIKIGNQTWMAENLAYLPEPAHPDSQGGIWVYHYLGSDTAEARKTREYQKYGCLYSYPTARDACPDGWHLPSDDEWKQLEIFIGMKKSEADSAVWRGTDQGDLLKDGSLSGFSVLFGGWRTGTNQFNFINEHANFWTSTEFDKTRSYERLLNINSPKIGRNIGNKDCGFSVRCIKDQ